MTVQPLSNKSAKPLGECQVGFPLLPPKMLRAFTCSAAGFLLLICLLLIAVLVPNAGTLSFVLDDPFIHLRLAENIWLGHYGINLSEVSAPASSILWPFLLAPFAALPFAAWLLLLLNVLLALGVMYFVAASLAIFLPSLSSRFLTILLCGFILLANLPALVFVGMEHVLQLLLSVMMIYGLIAYSASEPSQANAKIKYWLWLALFLSPLVRYENSLLVAAILLFLFLRGFYWQALLTGLCIAVSLISFSWFLHSLDLGWLPTSILLKSSADVPLFERITEKLYALLVTPKAWCLVLGLALFLRIALFAKVTVERQLAACAALFTALFLLLGSFGWYYRYEAFAWLSVALLLVFLYRGTLALYIAGGRRQKMASIAVIALLSLEHIFVTLLVPLAANNIYLQQYQMARFVRDYYQAPVAVNDIGWVSYMGEQYVLDLWGLASQQAMVERLSPGAGVQWMQDLTLRKDAGLAMIYFNDQGDADGWFEAVPEQWQRLGSLKMLAAGVSVSKREVVFFSTHASAHEKALQDISLFAPSLPELAVFEFFSE